MASLYGIRSRISSKQYYMLAAIAPHGRSSSSSSSSSNINSSSDNVLDASCEGTWTYRSTLRPSPALAFFGGSPGRSGAEIENKVCSSAVN